MADRPLVATLNAGGHCGPAAGDKSLWLCVSFLVVQKIGNESVLLQLLMERDHRLTGSASEAAAAAGPFAPPPPPPPPPFPLPPVVFVAVEEPRGESPPPPSPPPGEEAKMWSE